jgi:hypothetical protein
MELQHPFSFDMALKVWKTFCSRQITRQAAENCYRKRIPEDQTLLKL